MLISSLYSAELNYKKYQKKVTTLELAYVKYFRKCNKNEDKKCFYKKYTEFHNKRVDLARKFLKLKRPKRDFERLTKKCIKMEKKLFLGWEESAQEVFDASQPCFDKKLAKFKPKQS